MRRLNINYVIYVNLVKSTKTYLFRVSMALGPIGLHSVADQYPYIAYKLLLNSAESYPALFGKITAPILQDGDVLIQIFVF